MSTYLDLTKAATNADKPDSTSVTYDPESVDLAAKVLAAISGGAHLVSELHEKTQLETRDDALRAELTEPTRMALG